MKVTVNLGQDGHERYDSVAELTRTHSGTDLMRRLVGLRPVDPSVRLTLRPLWVGVVRTKAGASYEVLALGEGMDPEYFVRLPVRREADLDALLTRDYAL